MKTELSKYEKELSAKPVGQASIELQVKIDRLKSQIEGVKIWIEKEAFKSTHGEINVGVVPASDAGRTLGKMAEDFQNEENNKHPKQQPDILTHDYIKKMKLPEFDMPKLEPKKSGFEQWNEAVDKAYQKNQDMVESMGAVGSAMGSIGQAVGGAAGEWLNWAGNVVQSIGAVIPQILALIGVQRQEVTAKPVPVLQQLHQVSLLSVLFWRWLLWRVCWLLWRVYPNLQTVDWHTVPQWGFSVNIPVPGTIRK